jgi:CheY-like chemotaxis protein
MDISIPKINGLQATRTLKLDTSTMHIPIIALTAHALPADRNQAVEAGCDAYIAKPVEPRRVLAEVRRLLDVTET